MTHSLGQDSKIKLLGIAEWSISSYLEHGIEKNIPERFTPDQSMRQKSGVFVSVYVDNDLRGCMGTFSEVDELHVNVKRLAVQAAYKDKRFMPVRKDELQQMTIELSVLSPRQKIQGPEEIIIGKHGVFLYHGSRSATLLPQVAIEHDFNAIEFLECCAQNKLGMSKDVWREADIYVYESQVIR